MGGSAGNRLLDALRGSGRGAIDFEALFDREAAPLLGFLTLRTGDRALAEEVLADAFERAWRKQGGFDPRRGTQRSWLYSIAINISIDHLRRRQAEQRAVERTAAASPQAGVDPYGGVEDRDLLGRAAQGLSAEEREAIALRFGADLTMPEISELIGEPLSTVEGRIYRALRKLRDAISG